jgi:hypothetical protein
MSCVCVCVDVFARRPMTLFCCIRCEMQNVLVGLHLVHRGLHVQLCQVGPKGVGHGAVYRCAASPTSALRPGTSLGYGN